jgi:hypothetical protein
MEQTVLVHIAPTDDPVVAVKMPHGWTLRQDAVGEDVRKKRERRIIYTLTTPPAGETRVYAAFIRKHRYEPRDRLSLVEARWHEQNEEWMTVRTIPVRLDGCPEGHRRRRVPAEVVDEIIRQCGGAA